MSNNPDPERVKMLAMMLRAKGGAPNSMAKMKVPKTEVVVLKALVGDDGGKVRFVFHETCQRVMYEETYSCTISAKELHEYFCRKTGKIVCAAVADDAHHHLLT